MKNLKKLAVAPAIALILGTAAATGVMNPGTASADVFDVTIANVTTRAFSVVDSPVDESDYRMGKTSSRSMGDSFDSFESFRTLAP